MTDPIASGKIQSPMRSSKNGIKQAYRRTECLDGGFVVKLIIVRPPFVLPIITSGGTVAFPCARFPREHLALGLGVPVLSSSVFLQVQGKAQAI